MEWSLWGGLLRFGWITRCKRTFQEGERGVFFPELTHVCKGLCFVNICDSGVGEEGWDGLESGRRDRQSFFAYCASGYFLVHFDLSKPQLHLKSNIEIHCNTCFIWIGEQLRTNNQVLHYPLLTEKAWSAHF